MSSSLSEFLKLTTTAWTGTHWAVLDFRTLKTRFKSVQLSQNRSPQCIARMLTPRCNDHASDLAPHCQILSVFIMIDQSAPCATL